VFLFLCPLSAARHATTQPIIFPSSSRLVDPHTQQGCTGTSWINQMERWFVSLTEKRLRRSAFRSTRELEAAIRHHIDQHNQEPWLFRWIKAADQILASVARFYMYMRTSPTGHEYYNSPHPDCALGFESGQDYVSGRQ
jgi:hypothetical protein